MKKKKYFQFLCLWLVFSALMSLGAQCEELGGNPFSPVDPVMTSYVAIGDSITQGVMSGDGNFFTQHYAYPNLIGEAANTAMGVPSMVAEPSGYHRTEPGTFSHNLGVSGMDVFLSSITATNKTVANWKRASDPSPVANDSTYAFTDELDAVLAPYPKNSSALDIATTLSPTIITFWLGNNDALGSVANTSAQDPTDTSKYSSGLPLNLSIISEGGIPYTTPGPNFPYACQLDDADLRGTSYYPAARMSTNPVFGSSFQTAYQSALDNLLTNNPNAKIVIGNVPDVTATAHLMSFDEVKQFFIRYAGVVQAELDGVWGTTGFGGNAGSLVAFDGVVVALGIFKAQRTGGAPTTTALGALSQGKAIGSGGNIGFFDWDVNNLTTTELATIQSLLTSINSAISTVISGLSTADQARVTSVDINGIFNTIVTGNYQIKDGAGNVVGTIGRVYPGAHTTTTYSGLFSLDGIHPGPTAHALVANEFIKAINTKWGLAIPSVDEAEVYSTDPLVDHDGDGYVVGFSFTLQSSIGSTTILRDSNDADPNDKPTPTP